MVRELASLSSIINHGRRARGIHANNPVALVRKATQPTRQASYVDAVPVVILALESAMPRSELLALRSWEIDH